MAGFSISPSSCRQVSGLTNESSKSRPIASRRVTSSPKGLYRVMFAILEPPSQNREFGTRQYHKPCQWHCQGSCACRNRSGKPAQQVPQAAQASATAARLPCPKAPISVAHQLIGGREPPKRCPPQSVLRDPLGVRRRRLGGEAGPTPVALKDLEGCNVCTGRIAGLGPGAH